VLVSRNGELSAKFRGKNLPGRGNKKEKERKERTRKERD